MATDVTVGASGGATMSRALPAAATRPALLPSAHCMPAARHHTAMTTTNTMLYADVSEPTKTAPPICSATMITSCTRPPGLSCSAMAPPMTPAPAAHMAAAPPSTASASTAIARIPSRLRVTAPMSGAVGLRASKTRLPVVTRPF